MRWKNFHRQNDVSLSVAARTKATSLNSRCVISERDCQKIIRTKFSIISFRPNKREWAWASPSFDRSSRLTAARSPVRMLLIAEHVWLFGFLPRAAKFRKAKRQHERIG